MASKIKGIVIEIGGNVKPLERALNDVNKTSRNLQSELRDCLLYTSPSPRDA